MPGKHKPLLDTLPTKQGIVFDIENNQVLSKGFIRSHSPRIYKCQLYLLNSADGSLVQIDRITGDIEVVARFPGFTRGLYFYEDYAFIGLSKLRTDKNPLAKEFPLYQSHGSNLKSGLLIYDLQQKQTVGFLEYKTEMTEVYDIAILPNYTRSLVLNTSTEYYKKSFTFPNQLAFTDVTPPTDT